MIDEVITNIAATLEKSVEELSRDIWALAEFLENKGNRGMTTGLIEATVKTQGINIPFYFLKDECEAAFHGIIFESFDGYKRQKHRVSNGWMVRKKPYWKTTWTELYGDLDPDRRAAILKAEEEKRAAEEEAKRLKRRVEYFSEGNFEKFTTLQIAHRAACADVLRERCEYRWRKYGSFGLEDPSRFMQRVYFCEWTLLIEELVYRSKDPQPDSRYHRSKKALREAAEDYQKAKRFINRTVVRGFEEFEQFDPFGITDYFFTKEFVKQAIESAEEPNLTVHFDHLPKQPTDKVPVRLQTDRELMQDFMRFAMGHQEPGSFEYEDIQTILSTVRKMYARARGQKTGEDVIISKDEAV